MRELKNEIGEEIKELCIFNPPRPMYCWNGLETPVERDVSAVALCYTGLVAITFDREMFNHCAAIGKPIELRKMD